MLGSRKGKSCSAEKRLRRRCDRCRKEKGAACFSRMSTRCKRCSLPQSCSICKQFREANDFPVGMLTLNSRNPAKRCVAYNTCAANDFMRGSDTCRSCSKDSFLCEGRMLEDRTNPEALFWLTSTPFLAPQFIYDYVQKMRRKENGESSKRQARRRQTQRSLLNVPSVEGSGAKTRVKARRSCLLMANVSTYVLSCGAHCPDYWLPIDDVYASASRACLSHGIKTSWEAKVYTWWT